MRQLDRAVHDSVRESRRCITPLWQCIAVRVDAHKPMMRSNFLPDWHRTWSLPARVSADVDALMKL